MMEPICLQPLGVIRTPFTDPVGMPIQAIAAQGVQGHIELDEKYQAGLRDIEGFDYLILVYHLHQIREPALVVTPFLDSEAHGVFATRSPKRPNALGLSTVRLLRVEGSVLHISDVDMLDGTPLLDIKPYVPQFDNRANARIGWFEKQITRVQEVRAEAHKL
jgi:tRNA (adenine37-N6)-methyltransferase